MRRPSRACERHVSWHVRSSPNGACRPRILTISWLSGPLCLSLLKSSVSFPCLLMSRSFPSLVAVRG